MRRLPLALATLTVPLAAVAALGTVGAPPVAVVNRANVVPLAAEARTGTYPVYDARGRVVRHATWTVTPAGGNCCEVYITSTARGRLVEFGGTTVVYSDDRGRTWKQVKPQTPLYNGEGAAVAGPNGDVYAVSWDAYTGDHLQSVRHSAVTGGWDVAEAPLHSPFYDREWITYAKGPFTVNGTRAKGITYVVGGTVKDQGLLSTDGLVYDTVTVPAHDEQSLPTVPMHIPVVRDLNADWWQPHPDAGTLPLTGGGLVYFKNASTIYGDGCMAARLRQEDGLWQCVTLPFTVEPTAVVRQDSRGWLTRVTPVDGAEAFQVSVSGDGGRTWRSVRVAPPVRGVVDGGESSPSYDVKVNGRLGVAVISTRIQTVKGFQDMVFRLDVSKPAPRHVETLFVGRGDLVSGSNVLGALGDRMDFASVALLPDGKIAVSFDDSTTLNPTATKPQGHSPELAIER